MPATDDAPLPAETPTPWSPYPRPWETVHPPIPTPGGSSFTLATYNLLTDDCIEPGEYEYCPEELRYTSGRHPRVIQEIEAMCPDVLCLQEVSHHHYHAQLCPDLGERGYRGVYHHRRDGQGLATFYRQDTWGLVLQKQCLQSHLAETHLQVRNSFHIYHRNNIRLNKK